MATAGRRQQDASNLAMADHDLLITIAAKLEGLVMTCNGLTMELGKKADTKDAETWRTDHEARIRVLEQFNWRLAGALAILQLAVGVALHYWKP